MGSLVLFNRVVAVIFASYTFFVCKSLWKVAPLWMYVSISIWNVYASTWQHEVLRYASVLKIRWCSGAWQLVGTFSGSRIGEFLVTGPISPTKLKVTSRVGLGLLGVLLVLDGFTSTCQEESFQKKNTFRCRPSGIPHGCHFAERVSRLACEGHSGRLCPQSR